MPGMFYWSWVSNKMRLNFSLYVWIRPYFTVYCLKAMLLMELSLIFLRSAFLGAIKEFVFIFSVMAELISHWLKWKIFLVVKLCLRSTSLFLDIYWSHSVLIPSLVQAHTSKTELTLVAAHAGKWRLNYTLMDLIENVLAKIFWAVFLKTNVLLRFLSFNSPICF